jgi:hypothetical protein
MENCKSANWVLTISRALTPREIGDMIGPMSDTLQSLCEQGQELLSRMEYLDAEATLLRAEAMALSENDLDTLSRLYMPLQEARRQIRQRCGEGIVKLDLIARDNASPLDAEKIVADYPHGQLLIADAGSIATAMKVRALARERRLYVETFLAAVYRVGVSFAVAIVGLPDVAMPDLSPRSIDELIRALPAHSLVLSENELPRGEQRGDWKTFSFTMDWWERLHAPYLAAADMQCDPMLKIEGYRKTIRVDNACELAHQRLSDVARSAARHG